MVAAGVVLAAVAAGALVVVVVLAGAVVLPVATGAVVVFPPLAGAGAVLVAGAVVAAGLTASVAALATSFPDFFFLHSVTNLLYVSTAFLVLSQRPLFSL